MNPKEVIFSPNAEREIKALQKKDLKTVWDALKKLRCGADNLSIEKIKSQLDFFRIRAGNMRIIYYPLSQGRVVILVIRDRKNAYQRIQNLGSNLDSALRKLGISR